MKKIFTTLIFILFFSSNALAVTLYEALKYTFKNNTQLNAERENIKASEEDINISEADYMPSLTLTGTKSFEDTNKLTNQNGGDASINDVNPLTSSIKLEQTLLDFGRNLSLEKNIVGLKLAKAKLTKKEQDVIYSAIQSFTGLILAREQLNINKRNLNLLERQVETDSLRLERGQITISDLAQSESALAGAKAKYIQAQNDVIINKLNYENIIGNIENINDLKKSLKSIVAIPKSLESAIDLSMINNPDIKIAKFELNKSKKDIEIAKSELSPSATLSLERSYVDDLSSTYNEREKDVLKATVSWPFYSGGSNRALINKNQSLKNRKKLLLDSAIKTNQSTVTSAWSNLQSSKSLLSSVRSQVNAAEIANEGISAEYERGSGRTTLDVIQSNTLLLNAQISLANSERNYILAQYNLLKSVGLLDSSYLKLN